MNTTTKSEQKPRLLHAKLPPVGHCPGCGSRGSWLPCYAVLQSGRWSPGCPTCRGQSTECDQEHPRCAHSVSDARYSRVCAETGY